MLKKRIRTYDSQESRSINKTAEWLENYQGIVECDNFITMQKFKQYC